MLEYGNTNAKNQETTSTSVQNTILVITASCTQDSNPQHLRDKTSTLSIGTHFKLHATQQKSGIKHKHTFYMITINIDIHIET